MVNVKNMYDDVVALQLHGKIKKQDYEEVIPILEDRIKEFGNINFYCELMNLEEIEPKAIWEDLKFDAEHANDFNRIALVGDKKWVEWMTKFSSPFTSAKVEYFDHSEKHKAMDWVEGKVTLEN